MHRRIVLHTRLENVGRVQHTDLIFEGVLDYRFEDDFFQNILFDAEESSFARLLDDWGARFEENSPWGWPSFWKRSREATLRHLENSGAKVFEISATMGLYGWVVAREMRLAGVEPVHDD